MKRKGIKNIIFDFGGVLIDLDRQRCIENFRKLGLEDVETMLDIYHQQDFFQKYEKGLITSAEFREVIRTKATRPVSDKQIDDAWNSFLVSIPSYKLECLLELRKHHMVYLLSNTNEIHWQWSCWNAFPYKAFRVEDYFDRIYLSYEMKKAKPDVEIFQEVLDDAGILPQETLFMDDSQANCRAAEALGISTYTPKPGEDWRNLVIMEN